MRNHISSYLLTRHILANSLLYVLVNLSPFHNIKPHERIYIGNRSVSIGKPCRSLRRGHAAVSGIRAVGIGIHTDPIHF